MAAKRENHPVDFAKALELSVPADHAALKRWYETVSGRPSAAA